MSKNVFSVVSWPLHHIRTCCRWGKNSNAHVRSSSRWRWPRPYFFHHQLNITYISERVTWIHIISFNYKWANHKRQLVKLVLGCCSWVNRTSDNWHPGHSPIDTSWAKAREMRNEGSPTARSVTSLSAASSKRSPLYLTSVGSFSTKSEKTYSAATPAIAMIDGDNKLVLSNCWENIRAFWIKKQK